MFVEIVLNLIIRYFLLKTKRFTEKDIKLKLTNYFGMVHQQLKVRINKKWKVIDIFSMRIKEKIN